MNDTILNTAAALRLARRAGGVTVSQLAEARGITRPSAHAILVRLVGAGELVREGGVGRGGHVYHQQTPQKMSRVSMESGPHPMWSSLHQAVFEGRVFHRGHRVKSIDTQIQAVVYYMSPGKWFKVPYNDTDDQLDIRDK